MSWAKVIGKESSTSLGFRTKIKLLVSDTNLLYLVILGDFTAASFTSATPTIVHHHLSMDQVIFLGIILAHSLAGTGSTLVWLMAGDY